ncbi:RsmD family RNA methyltransferase [Candidatus Nomurabacteria bacterium]|uniref:RsmD family RNA methyltransferase n=1 Tax=Candidatus Dojkabacteria bacterium TaxID=2099670 RepID=A0A955I0Q4_9BACT|nr:RsmD family RNA methyltransferase [Candidatus Dojkabacteria bacterium]MCB9789904.1 RsmD family RNA methyltransferase [Candidatus Nomurabacteria bacterium]MCB9803473.1 RsmD family RNA methyltransferase [Candidatus Nomurabacteria bacterium]
MSLKHDSLRKLRKQRTKWKVESWDEYELRERELLKQMATDNILTTVGQVKVSAGKAKGAMLDIPKKTRPLTNRMKTQIFDMLERDISNRTVLDLYAGSGSFGIEALSRGAKSCLFVDAGKQAISCIEGNIQKTGFLLEAIVVKEKVEEFVKKTLSAEQTYEVIFIDPPYKLYNRKRRFKILEMIQNSSRLLPGIKNPGSKKFPGVLILKHPNHYPISDFRVEGIRLLETYEFGMNAITLFVVETENSKRSLGD